MKSSHICSIVRAMAAIMTNGISMIWTNAIPHKIVSAMVASKIGTKGHPKIAISIETKKITTKIPSNQRHIGARIFRRFSGRLLLHQLSGLLILVAVIQASNPKLIGGPYPPPKRKVNNYTKDHLDND